MKKQITEKDVQRALKLFRKSGGLIRKLPDQHAPNRAMPAGDGAYEAMEDFLSETDYLN